MAAIISKEHAKATWLTGAVGLLILAAAFVMMACAPPSLVHARPHGAVTQAARAYTSSVITESWSANRAGRAGESREAPRPVRSKGLIPNGPDPCGRPGARSPVPATAPADVGLAVFATASCAGASSM